MEITNSCLFYFSLQYVSNPLMLGKHISKSRSSYLFKSNLLIKLRLTHIILFEVTATQLKGIKRTWLV